MKLKITLELFEEYAEVNTYSFIIDDNVDCEMDLFIKRLENEGKTKDLPRIIGLIDQIGNKGAEERYFRYEGKKSDDVYALPGHYTFKSKYRLYCLRYGDAILILGNGGLKTTKTYQEDPHLKSCVEMLQKIDKEIKKLQKSGLIRIDKKTITGCMEFYI